VETRTPGSDGRRTLDAYFAAIASLEPARIAACFRSDGEMEDPIGSPIRNGHDEIQEYWSGGLCAVAAAVEIEVVAAFPAGKSIAGHWQMTARSRGGAIARAEGIDVLRLDGAGLIRRAEGYWDQAAFRDALIQRPSPEGA
jgi:steroid Delta-isomerase